MAIRLYVADRRLDGGWAPKYLFDLAVDAALLAGEEDSERLRRVVAAVALVGVDAFDPVAGEGLGLRDDGAQGVAMVGFAGQGIGVEHELAALAAPVGGHDGDLDPELVRSVGFALADALGLWRVVGIEFLVTSVLALATDLHGLAQENGEDPLQPVVTLDLVSDIADQTAQAHAQELELAVAALTLLGVGISPGPQCGTLGDARLGLTELGAVRPGQLAQLLDRLDHHVGVGRMGHVLRLNRGVRGDPCQVVLL